MSCRILRWLTAILGGEGVYEERFGARLTKALEGGAIQCLTYFLNRFTASRRPANVGFGKRGHPFAHWRAESVAAMY